jgi:cytochrome oxidase Cu insertion factor (SCO1/SenC/PrrC family)
MIGEERVVKAETQSGDRTRARLSFVGIVLLFALPLLLAIGLYAGGWRPLARVNNGELVNPPRDVSNLVTVIGAGGERLPADLLTGQWSVVHVVEAACDQRCEDELYQTRQVWTALGKDASRVQRVLFSLDLAAPELAADLRLEHPDLITAKLEGAAFGDGMDSVWLVDPLGNLILRYPPGHPSRGLLKDIKRLLKLSKIG